MKIKEILSLILIYIKVLQYSNCIKMTVTENPCPVNGKEISRAGFKEHPCDQVS